jgi:cell wall-associated NlpC family hydrolase
MRGALALVIMNLLIAAESNVRAQPPIRSNRPEELRREVVEVAGDFIGTPYVSGGTGKSGVDCSGLVYGVYRQVLGRAIPRTVKRQSSFVEFVERDQLLPGDLVFFNTVGPFSHVGIYVGDSRVVHAASEYNRDGVIISRFDRNYYQTRFNRAGRVAELNRDEMKLIADTAESFLGTPYLSGGADRTGADCSGFVCAAFEEALGVSLPRRVRDMATTVTPVSRDLLLPGDLLFFDTDGPLSHVGIYLGKDKVIHSASVEIKNGVLLSDMEAPYYVEHYAAAGRILPVEPISWVFLRSMTGTKIVAMGRAELASGVALYYNSLGPIDLGVDARIEYTFDGGSVSFPLTVNLLVDKRMWFRVGYEANGDSPSVTSTAPAVVPDIIGFGIDIAPTVAQSSRYSLSLEAEYRLGAGPLDSADDRASIISSFALFLGASFMGEF